MNLWASHSTRKTICRGRSSVPVLPPMKIVIVGSLLMNYPRNLTANHRSCITTVLPAERACVRHEAGSPAILDDQKQHVLGIIMFYLSNWWWRYAFWSKCMNAILIFIYSKILKKNTPSNVCTKHWKDKRKEVSVLYTIYRLEITGWNYNYVLN